MTPLRRKMIEELQIRPRAVSRQRNSLRRMVRFAQHYRRWAHFETIGIPPARRSREANESPLTPTTTCGTPATQTKRHFTVILNQFNHPTGRLPACSALFFRLRPARDTPPGNAMCLRGKYLADSDQSADWGHNAPGTPKTAP
jgi:hypothetical protein